MINILVVDPLDLLVIDLLREIPEFEIREFDGSPDALKNCEVLIMKDRDLFATDIEDAGNLQLIIKFGAKQDNIDLANLQKRKIDIVFTSSAKAITVAEYTIGQILSACRFIGPAYQSMKEKKWRHDELVPGVELYGKTVGIVGFGHVGQEVAKRLAAFGVSIIFCDLLQIKHSLNARQTSFQQVLRVSDIITVHVPLTDVTNGMFGRREFQEMKNDAILVNMSHGKIVDESALLSVLDNHLRAVVLDVFAKEPPDDFQLISHEKIFPAPHLCASTLEGRRRSELNIVSILKEFFNV